ncbi:hypothetical protein Pflav_061360 [Phytohabitans flavus]|uniref:Uncharacterized protein n=1 Tax=Phytohabitans flavus TaxID=1076124 RepID=A0A6F8Y0U4_9ACTN|nr:hypothetical protein Pflav_061360 [Phytohabitans flavus]
MTSRKFTLSQPAASRQSLVRAKDVSRHPRRAAARHSVSSMDGVLDGRYRLEGEIAQGAIGAVWRAVDMVTGGWWP